MSTHADRPIVVIGVHGGEVFGRRAAEALAGATVIVAAPRHQAMVDLDEGQRVVPLVGPLHAVLDQVAEARSGGASVAVLASGDPGFFGIVRLLGERFGTDAVIVHPAPSSVSLAFGRIGTTWDDAVVVSAHGRPPDAAVAAVCRFAKVAVLTSPQTRPEQLGALLLEARCRPRSVAVASRLGEAGEIVSRTDLAGLAAGSHDPISIVIFADPDPVTDRTGPDGVTLAWGLAETEFAHRGGLITKSEVRAVALGKLALPARGVLWDIGAGSGSVAIECSRLQPHLRVLAIERDPDAARLIRENARAHGVAVEVVEGSSPEALADLPTPDRVFVGGGGMDGLRAAWERLAPGGTLVATHVLVDRAAQAWAVLGDSVQVAASRAVPIADGFRLDAQNPVFVSWGSR